MPAVMPAWQAQKKKKTDVGRLSHCSRSLWVIIWDSLPLTSKYGWDCERAHGRMWKAEEPPRDVRAQELWASFCLEICVKECWEFENEMQFTRVHLCNDSVKHSPSCRVFHQSSHWGDIPSRKAWFLFPRPPALTGDSLLPSLCSLCEASGWMWCFPSPWATAGMT